MLYLTLLPDAVLVLTGAADDAGCTDAFTTVAAGESYAGLDYAALRQLGDGEHAEDGPRVKAVKEACRVPAGQPEGGQFVPCGDGGSGDKPVAPVTDTSPVGYHRGEPWRPDNVKYDQEVLSSRMAIYKDGLGEKLRQGVTRSGGTLQGRVVKLRAERDAIAAETEALFQAYHKASRDSSDNPTPEGDQARAAALKVLEDAHDRFNTKNDAVYAAKDALRDKVLDGFRNRNVDSNPKLEDAVNIRSHVDESATPMDAGLKERVGQVTAWLDGQVAKEYRGSEEKPWDIVARQIPADQDQRANHSGGAINLTKDTDHATILHEIGHALEYRYPAAAEAARAFYKGRVKDEPLVSFRDKFGGGYKDGEVGAKDGFEAAMGGDESRAYYAGKFYQHGATEITSMGLEQLYRDPVAFAKADPEYFHFVTGMLNGRLR